MNWPPSSEEIAAHNAECERVRQELASRGYTDERKLRCCYFCKFIRGTDDHEGGLDWYCSFGKPFSDPESLSAAWYQWVRGLPPVWEFAVCDKFEEKPQR